MILRNIIVLIAILLIGGIAYSLIRQKRQRGHTVTDETKERYKQRINGTLEKIAGEFSSRALAYQLTRLAPSYNLSEAEIDQLFANYPELTACPYVDWIGEFSFLGQHYALLDGSLRRFLDEKGYQGYPDFRQPDRFENCLVDAAVPQAEGILRELRGSKTRV